MEDLKPDLWREKNPFSKDVEGCHQVILDVSTSRTEKAEALSRWLERYQPCLFGRMAAKQGRLSFCILTEPDFTKGDQHVREVIQDSRQIWQREGLTRKKHGFIILAASNEVSPG